MMWVTIFLGNFDCCSSNHHFSSAAFVSFKFDILIKEYVVKFWWDGGGGAVMLQLLVR